MAKQKAGKAQERVVVFQDKKYNIEGMPKDVQDLYDALTAGERAMSEAIDAANRALAQVEQVKGRKAAISEFLMKRVFELQDVKKNPPVLKTKK